MQMVFCLNCRAGNSPDRMTCTSCGMPLPTQLHLDEHTGLNTLDDFQPPADSVEERVEVLEDKVNGLTSTIEEILTILEHIPSQLSKEVAAAERLNRHIEETEGPRADHDDLWNRKFRGYLRFIDSRQSFERKFAPITQLHKGGDAAKLEKLIKRSEILFQSNQQLRALKILERALRLSPDNYELLYFIGEKYFLIHQPERAAEIWRHVLSLKPDHYRASLMGGILAMLAGNLADARRMLTDTTHQKADSVVPILALATLELQEGNHVEAERYVVLANKLHETACGHILRAESFSRRDQPRKAIRQLELAHGFQPDDRNILLRLAVLYMHSGFTRRARETFNKVGELSPKDDFYKIIASKRSGNEMIAMAAQREELAESSILIHSVSELIRQELEQ